jgi:hypothetical protein
MKKIFLFFFISYSLLFAEDNLFEKFNSARSLLDSGSGKIGDKHTFLYSFSDGLVKGANLLKIEILDENKNRMNVYDIDGDYFLTNYSGNLKKITVKKNKNNKLYFVPIVFSAVGNYRINLLFKESGKIISTNFINVNVR